MKGLHGYILYNLKEAYKFAFIGRTTILGGLSTPEAGITSPSQQQNNYQRPQQRRPCVVKRKHASLIGWNREVRFL